ncbi:MAG: DUF502 domain-containing protein [Hydrogenothermaceae bacterium]|nr:DUF502 domain-containing protein [Hydrogenothermaceae bacterium]
MIQRIKNYLITGLFVLIPIAITFWVVKAVLTTINDLILPYIRLIGIPIPEIPGIGIVITLSIIFILGVMTQNYAGKRILLYWELLISKIPIVRSIYNATKQTVETLFLNKESFSKVVLVKYPHPDSLAIGFLSNQVKVCENEKYLVFVPAALNPTSGFLLFVNKDDLIFTDLTVEEAMRTVLSGGLVIKKKIKLIKDSQTAEAEAI